MEDGGAAGAGKAHAADVRRGDDSEEFAFAAQFPVFLQPVLRRLTDPCHALFCAPPASAGSGSGSRGFGRGNVGARRYHYHQHHHGAFGSEGPHSAPMDPPGGVGAGAAEEETVKERRKELASRGARLLEERMARGAAAAAAAADAAAAAAAAQQEAGEMKNSEAEPSAERA